MSRLILASQSPRRREILERAGLAAEVRATTVEERRVAGESPREYVQRLAREKAEAIAASEGDVVLGADTTVVIDGLVLEKPVNSSDATEMLARLSGREHTVMTGICLKQGNRVVVDCEETIVRFVPLTVEEIREYVASGEPTDKAGAYAIQGLASKFIDRIEGCYWNVVGLPVAKVYAHLKREFGFPTA